MKDVSIRTGKPNPMFEYAKEYEKKKKEAQKNQTEQENDKQNWPTELDRLKRTDLNAQEQWEKYLYPQPDKDSKIKIPIPGVLIETWAIGNFAVKALDGLKNFAQAYREFTKPTPPEEKETNPIKKFFKLLS